MSYQIDILIDIPGRELMDVVGANFEGDAPLDPGPVDLVGIGERVAALLPNEAEVEPGADSLWAFDSGTGLQLDREPTGGQINLPLAPSEEAHALTAAILAVVGGGTNLFGFDAQLEARIG